MNERDSVGSSSSYCTSTSSTPSNQKRVKTAGVIIIGDEIIKGQVHDTNSYFICKHLYSIGVKVVRINVIRDGIDEISEEVKKFSATYDIVITTGGIGPTHDDVTYLGVAKAFDESVAIHNEMSEMIEKWLSRGGYKQEVIMRMAQLPKSAKLLFDPALPSLSSFPIVNVRNVYVFPGVPQFLEKMFLRMTSILCIGEGNNVFHTGEIYVNKDELSITPEIDDAVDKFNDCVTFGSYPVVGNLYYSTKVTMESNSSENVQQAKEYLSGLLPPNSVIQYDKQPLETASSKVYEMTRNKEHELHGIMQETIQTLETALERYPMNALWICFNGGKDCTALLHLMYAVFKTKFPESKEKIQALCIQSGNAFPEMDSFVDECSKKYNLNLCIYDGPIHAGLRQAMSEHPEMKAVLMGTRRSDPSGKNLDFFQMTDPTWPQVMRVSPMLEWSFSDVWKFIRNLSLSYCPLYDRGGMSARCR